MAERRMKERRLNDPGDPEWYKRLHRLWTWAVGKEGYNRKDWQDFSECLGNMNPARRREPRRRKG